MKKLLLVLTLAAGSLMAHAQSEIPAEGNPSAAYSPAPVPPPVPVPAAPQTSRAGNFESKIGILGHRIGKFDDSANTHPPQSAFVDAAEVVVPSMFFLTVIAIVAGGYILRYRQKVLLHQTVRAMVEKGMEVPPALLDPQGRTKAPRSDLRRGIVLIGVGIGLSVFLALVHTSAWGLGLIPLCIGIGYIVVWKLETRDSIPR